MWRLLPLTMSSILQLFPQYSSAVALIYAIVKPIRIGLTIVAKNKVGSIASRTPSRRNGVTGIS